MTRVFCLAVACAGCVASAPPRAEEPPADPVQDQEAEQLFAQGSGLAARGDYVRAEQYLAAAISRGYPEEDAMPLLLRACIAALRLRVAIEYADPYLLRHPADWRLHTLTASLYAGLEEPERARGHLEKALEENPDAEEAHYLLGVVLREGLDAPAEARAHLTRYLELSPDGAHAAEVRDLLEEDADTEPVAAAPSAPPIRVSATRETETAQGGPR